MTAERRFSQMTAEGVDPYDKPYIGHRHVWRYVMDARDAHRERDTEISCAHIRKMQAEYERMLNRMADQLLNPGYNPYNHANGARIIFRFSTPPHATRKS